MLDQNFSRKNIEKIYQYGRRNGQFSDSNFPKYIENKLRKKTLKIKELLSAEIKPLLSEIRDIKKKKDWLKKEELEVKLAELNEKKRDLYLDKIEIVLDYVSKKVNFKNFKFNLKTKKLDFGGKKKEVYFIEGVTEKFLMAHMQRVFERLYKVKQANRYTATSQIKALLLSKLEFYIFRTDIKDFYETIDSNLLIQKIKKDGLLSPNLKKILESTISEYMKVSGSSKGIPRGLGISAFLAELYMRNLDEKIKGLDNSLYYMRYVDDIIIFALDPCVVDILKSEILDLQLTCNPRKTKLIKPSQKLDFEYLGYHFSKRRGTLSIKLSKKSIEKYKSKIDRIFEDYELQKSKYGISRGLNEVLVKRIRYLTSNTRLNKSGVNINVGIYYNHSLLSDFLGLIRLDDYLELKISQSSLSKKLKYKVGRYSFLQGFKQKKFFSLVSNSDYKNCLNNLSKIKDIKKIINF